MEIKEIVKELIKKIGDNPERDGLKNTPKRVENMFEDIFKGYNKKLRPKISTFKNNKKGKQLITDSGEFYSICSHHLMPFFGEYYFGYISSEDGQLLGLSKISRIVDYYSSKLQMQEKIGEEVVEDLWDSLKREKGHPPEGMIILLEGNHLCKSMRGAKNKGKMKTLYKKGVFEKDSKFVNEFLGTVNRKINSSS